jgi:hypothetical protein
MRASKSSNLMVGAGVFALAASFFALPAVLRATIPHQNNREKLTGSQRQRGMYMNAGASDAGIDPDWDPITQTRRKPEKK